MALAVPAEPGLVLRPLTRAQYDDLVELGAFEDAGVELLEGSLVEVSPQGPRHGWVAQQLLLHLVRRLGEGWTVRAALPWLASDLSEPEPDLAVVPVERYDAEHPNRALLLVEVAQSSLAKDLGVKARLYAAAGVPTYWVVDVEAEVVHVHSDPTPTGYEAVVQQTFDAPLEVAGVTVLLADLLAG